MGMRHASVQKEGALRWGRWHAPAPYRGAKRFLGGSGRAAHRVLVPRSCPCTGGSARERSKTGTERRDGSMHMHADRTRRTTAGLLDSCSRRAGGQTLSYDPKCTATLFLFFVAGIAHGAAPQCGHTAPRRDPHASQWRPPRAAQRPRWRCRAQPCAPARRAPPAPRRAAPLAPRTVGAPRSWARLRSRSPRPPPLARGSSAALAPRSWTRSTSR